MSEELLQQLAVCVERGKREGNTYPLLSVLAGIVDGKELLPETWYTVKGGKWVECDSKAVEK